MFWPFNISIGKKNLKMICFDLDDTLCDSSSAEAETEVHIMNLIHKDLISHKLISKSDSEFISVMNLLKLFNEIKHSHCADYSRFDCFSRKLWIDDLLKKISAKKLYSKSSHYQDEYWKYFNSVAKLYSNTIYVLEYLKSTGIKIAMVTNSDGDKGLKMYRLKHLGITKYFDYIVTSDDTGHHKPDISNWELVLKKSGINPKECMMVGDHPDIDLTSPKKLGMFTVWTKQNINLSIHHRYVDYEIRDIQEICNVAANFSLNANLSK